MTNKYLRYFLLVVLVLTLSACVVNRKNIIRRTDNNPNINVATEVQPGEVAVIDSNIVINKPISSSVVTSPFDISGRAKTSDGKIYFRLRNAFGDIFATGTAQVMANDSSWGFYSAQLSFPMPLTPIANLEVYNINPKNGSEQDLIKLPVNFKEYQKPKVKAFFNNTEADPKLKDCGKVYPVEREVDFSVALIVSALKQLLAGPTDQDKNNGFVSQIPTKDITIQKLEAKDGIVYVDFNQGLQKAAGTDVCKNTAIRAQVVETLKQFPAIKDVVISVDGKTEGVLGAKK